MAKLTFKPGYQDLGPFPLLQPIVNAEGLEVTETTVVTPSIDGLYPGMIKTSTRLKYPAGQTLIGYKITGVVFLNGSDNYTIDIGTVTATNPIDPSFGISPYKVGGSVSIQYPCPFTTPFGNGASVWDDDANASVSVESMGFVTIPFDNIHSQILLTAYDSTVATTFSGVVLYEYEFFAPETSTVTFTPNI